jgi:hypothetical protein
VLILCTPARLRALLRPSRRGARPASSRRPRRAGPSRDVGSRAPRLAVEMPERGWAVVTGVPRPVSAASSRALRRSPVLAVARRGEYLRPLPEAAATSSASRREVCRSQKIPLTKPRAGPAPEGRRQSGSRSPTSRNRPRVPLSVTGKTGCPGQTHRLCQALRVPVDALARTLALPRLEPDRRRFPQVRRIVTIHTPRLPGTASDVAPAANCGGTHASLDRRRD